MARMTNQQMQYNLMLKGIGTLLDANPAFRKFVWTILREASIYYPTYSRVSPHDTSFNEGRRALGLEVLHMLKGIRPDILGLLEREGNLLEQAAKPPENEDDFAPPNDDDADADGPAYGLRDPDELS